LSAVRIVITQQSTSRNRAAGWASYGQMWKTVTGRQYFTDIIGLSVKKEKNRPRKSSWVKLKAFRHSSHISGMETVYVG